MTVRGAFPEESSYDHLHAKNIASPCLRRAHDEAFALASSLAEGPTLALRYMKDNLDEALLFDFATARDHEAERLVRTSMTSDHREAVQAFIGKRKAIFTGS